MNCGMTCVKYLVFIFNLLFALSGLAILVTGAVIEVGNKEYMEFVPHEIFSAPKILIVVGVIIFVIAFFGCCGAVRENNCMVLTFAVLLAIIFILELSAGIAAYVLRSDLETRMETIMLGSMQKFDPTNDNSIVTKSWNVMQHDMKCCGVKSYKDWDNVTGIAEHGYPKGCCPNLGADENCLVTSQGFQKEGCLKELAQVVKDNIEIVGGVGIGIAFIQLAGILFACCLSQAIRRDYETV